MSTRTISYAFGRASDMKHDPKLAECIKTLGHDLIEAKALLRLAQVALRFEALDDERRRMETQIKDFLWSLQVREGRSAPFYIQDDERDAEDVVAEAEWREER